MTVHPNDGGGSPRNSRHQDGGPATGTAGRAQGPPDRRGEAGRSGGDTRPIRVPEGVVPQPREPSAGGVSRR